MRAAGQITFNQHKGNLFLNHLLQVFRLFLKLSLQLLDKDQIMLDFQRNNAKTNLCLHLKQHLPLILSVKLLFHSQNLPAAVYEQVHFARANSCFQYLKAIGQKAEHCETN